MSAIYEARDLEQRYQQRTALPKLSLTIESGEAVALTGPNGCGKSTLLRLLAFIERPFSGELLYYGDRNNPRREVSLLLQDPYLLRASVFYNVTLGLRLRHRREQLESIYERCMRAVGFADPRSFAARGPNALSGGERQRVALAARLALNPRVLLLDELENELGIETYACNWPMGSGREFQGVYDRRSSQLIFFSGVSGKNRADKMEIDLYDPQVAQIIGERRHQQLIDDVELLGAGREFDLEEVRAGRLSPVFFGSALTNFGVEPFLEEFLRMTPSPLPREADCGVIDTFSPDFSAFVFKIQANMNKAHRDRLAFMRICSGQFQRDAEYYHVQSGKKMRLSQPQQLMASEREIVDEAYAGDIIGVFDPGIFSIGDTITVPGKKFKFGGIPTFAPEHFARVSAKDSMKRKQFLKGTEQIAQEGAIQIFKVPNSGMEEVIVGVVGTLQFDVFQYRMKAEYGVDLRMQQLPYEQLRFITKAPVTDLKDLYLSTDAELLEDYRGRSLLVFASQWSINFILKRNPGLELSETAQ